MRQMSDEGRREIAKELREQFNCCLYAEEFTEGLYDVLDLGHCEPIAGVLTVFTTLPGACVVDMRTRTGSASSLDLPTPAPSR